MQGKQGRAFARLTVSYGGRGERSASNFFTALLRGASWEIARLLLRREQAG